MLGSEWLKAFVAVGMLKDSRDWSATGAGVLFLDDDNFIWLVTAAHVVSTTGAGAVAPLLVKIDGTPVVVDLSRVQREAGIEWIVDGDNDIALSPMPRINDVDIRAVSYDVCLSIREVLPSMPAYTVGCPYGMHTLDPVRPAPLVLDGVISGTDIHAGLIYTSAPTFPGNSGGPLLVYRSPIAPDGSMYLGSKAVLLSGIMLETQLVPSPDDNPPMPPLHLGIARSVDAVISLLKSDRARSLSRHLRELKPRT